MNIHISQLFWGSRHGARVLTHNILNHLSFIVLKFGWLSMFEQRWREIPGSFRWSEDFGLGWHHARGSDLCLRHSVSRLVKLGVIVSIVSFSREELVTGGRLLRVKPFGWYLKRKSGRWMLFWVVGLSKSKSACHCHCPWYDMKWINCVVFKRFAKTCHIQKSNLQFTVQTHFLEWLITAVGFKILDPFLTLYGWIHTSSGWPPILWVVQPLKGATMCQRPGCQWLFWTRAQRTQREAHFLGFSGVAPEFSHLDHPVVWAKELWLSTFPAINGEPVGATNSVPKRMIVERCWTGWVEFKTTKLHHQCFICTWVICYLWMWDFIWMFTWTKTEMVNLPRATSQSHILP